MSDRTDKDQGDGKVKNGKERPEELAEADEQMVFEEANTVFMGRAIDPSVLTQDDTYAETTEFNAVDPESVRKDLSQEDLDQIVDEVGKPKKSLDGHLPSEVGELKLKETDENAETTIMKSKGLFDHLRKKKK